MKRYILPIAALMMLATGCDKSGEENLPAGTNDGMRLLLRPVVAQEADTRISLNENKYQWSEGDRIGLFIENATTPSQNIPADLYFENGDPYFATGQVEAAEGDKVYAYYPYHADAMFDNGYVTFPTDAEQTQAEAGVLATTSMPMSAVPTAVAAEGTVTTLQFVPMQAMIRFAVWSSNASYRTEKVEQITVQTYEAISGNVSIPYMNADPATAGASIDGFDATQIVTKLTTAAAVGAESTAAAEVYMTFPAMTVTGMEVIVTTDKANYTLTSSSSLIIFNRNEIKLLSLDLGGSFVHREEKTVEMPFTTELYDYMNRDPEGVYDGEQVDMGDGGLPGNRFGLRVELNEGSNVAKYWVYSAPWTDMEAYSDASKTADLLNLVVANGTMKTESATCEVLVRQGGPSKVTTATAVAVEYEDGSREVFRIYKLGAFRGMSVQFTWPN